MLDMLVVGATVLGALATMGGTYIGYKGYQQQSALRRLSVEVDAYLEAASRAHLLIVLRNNSDEAVRVSRLKVVKPDTACFQKARSDGYRSQFLALDEPLAPRSNDPQANLSKKAINAMLVLPAHRTGPGQIIRLNVRCEFASSIDKSGWIKTKTTLASKSGNG